MAEKKEESIQSRILKAKKCLASMGAKSSVGQKTILHFLGVPGTNLLVSLQSAAAKDVGEQKAKALIENIYILACKGKILYDAKIITPSNTKEFVAPVNATCIAIFLLLEEKRKNPSKQADVTGITLKFAQLESLVVSLLKPHIKAKNIDKATEVFKYFGTKRFLDLFVNNPNYHEFKTTLHRNLKLLIVDRLEEASLLPPPRLCKTHDCQAEALDEDGKFAGSHYCIAHHEKQYNILLKEPNVHHFLAENGFDYEPFVQMAEKHFPPNARMMYRGINNYQETNTRLRKNFAEGIYDKYLSENASNKVTCLSPACVEKVKETYKAAEVSCYDACSAELAAVLTPIFKQHFLNSEPYKEYLGSRKLGQSS
jgi:hypothetical protein